MSDAIDLRSTMSFFERPLPPGYRDELLALEATPQAAIQSSVCSVLIFRLGELRLALPTGVAAVVAPVLHIARVPNRSGTVLLGLVAFRGEIFPCCSLARILDLPEGTSHAASSTARTLLLEESTGRCWAVPIDGVFGVRSGQTRPSNAVSPIAAHWMQGSFEDDAGIYWLLNPDVLFRQINLATA